MNGLSERESKKLAEQAGITAKAMESLQKQVKNIDAALENSKIVDAAKSEAGFKGREFGITRFQKLSSIV